MSSTVGVRSRTTSYGNRTLGGRNRYVWFDRTGSRRERPGWIRVRTGGWREKGRDKYLGDGPRSVTRSVSPRYHSFASGGRNLSTRLPSVRFFSCRFEYRGSSLLPSPCPTLPTSQGIPPVPPTDSSTVYTTLVLETRTDTS